MSVASSVVITDRNGNPIPTEDATWVMRAPCGCICAAQVVQGVRGVDLAPDFCCTPAELAEDLAAGFSIEAMAVQEFRATGSCTHTPKWGVER